MLTNRRSLIRGATSFQGDPSHAIKAPATAPVLRYGRVVDVHPFHRLYLVRVQEMTTFWLGFVDDKTGGYGTSETGVISPGESVLVLCPTENPDTFVILSRLPETDSVWVGRRPSWMVPYGPASVARYQVMDERSHDFAGQTPLHNGGAGRDTFAGDWMRLNELGVGLGTGLTMAFLRSSLSTGVWAFQDGTLRESAEVEKESWLPGKMVQQKILGDMTFEYEQRFAHPWEENGRLSPDDPDPVLGTAEEAAARADEYLGQDLDEPGWRLQTGELPLTSNEALTIPRQRVFRGSAVYGEVTQTLSPPTEDGQPRVIGESSRLYDGTTIENSLSCLLFTKRGDLPDARELPAHEEVSPTYKDIPSPADVRALTEASVNVADDLVNAAQIRTGTGIRLPATKLWEKVDHPVPESPHRQPFTGEAALPSSEDLDLGNGLKSKIYNSSAFFGHLPDGSFLIRDAYGGFFHMHRGNIYYGCPGSIVQQPGRHSVSLVGGSTVIRGRASVDISASTGSVRVKSGSFTDIYAKAAVRFEIAGVAPSEPPTAGDTQADFRGVKFTVGSAGEISAHGGTGGLRFSADGDVHLSAGKNVQLDGRKVNVVGTFASHTTIGGQPTMTASSQGVHVFNRFYAQTAYISAQAFIPSIVTKGVVGLSKYIGENRRLVDSVEAANINQAENFPTAEDVEPTSAVGRPQPFRFTFRSDSEYRSLSDLPVYETPWQRAAVAGVSPWVESPVNGTYPFGGGSGGKVIKFKLQTVNPDGSANHDPAAYENLHVERSSGGGDGYVVPDEA